MSSDDVVILDKTDSGYLVHYFICGKEVIANKQEFKRCSDALKYGSGLGAEYGIALGEGWSCKKSG